MKHDELAFGAKWMGLGMVVLAIPLCLVSCVDETVNSLTFGVLGCVMGLFVWFTGYCRQKEIDKRAGERVLNEFKQFLEDSHDTHL